MLASLKNLGPRSAEMLAAAGIKDLATLRRLGAVRAYLAVKQAGKPVSLNLLWAIEGALLGVHWQEVARERRMHLLMQLDDWQGSGEKAI